MAKLSSVRKNQRRQKLSASHANKRAALKATIRNKQTPMEERFDAVLRLAALPRNGAQVRVRNRCELTGRPRATYRKFRLARGMLRDMANFGQIPGMTKSSW